MHAAQTNGSRIALACIAAVIVSCCGDAAWAQQGQVLTELENQVMAATREWQDTVMEAARSLFWILASIEIGLAAIGLALAAASLDSWFAELVRRILFIGFFAFVLDRGPAFAQAVVDSLFAIGAGQGSASPAEVFDAGIRVASALSEHASFGVFEDNALAIASVIAMGVVVICFSLVAAIFVAVMVEMYVGLLAGMIMLGLGGSSFTKDFSVRYLIYSFSVGMKLMALVMIARIGSEVLLGLASAPVSESDPLVSTLSIAGISVVVFIVSLYVPSIVQGVVQGVSVTQGGEAIRHGMQATTMAAGGAFVVAAGAQQGTSAAISARAGGASLVRAAMTGLSAGAGQTARALGSAARDKLIAAPGASHASLLGLANEKLRSGPSQKRGKETSP
ncbi:P-type conjugative transfer protein TrbL (plasmid) [Rhizobium sp. WL3]|uniref:P-type conjugative transfer protein TrbL n=1 Tax=Rhizobium sp. WL3 TaxID=2603277 RepID=UPI0011C1EE1A|nr:P-type conjugative transfer protein TrbL [Rhizobium sp. WL3]QEE43454.1 P-type conjugative transfer protein TrbL [Rhizobium sp. WL3]